MHFETIALDTETYGLSPFEDDIFSVQIGTGKNNYLIDLEDRSTSLFPENCLKMQEVIPYIDNKTVLHD